ncbi:hypothetical protein CROQUDRAFT_665557 [Cronartium quercuum f. sp. fusiforme G11]|uniref:Uncharacterized protein n=1 Tax=Cronartium quercuum f. sp. fusiforme G11 TaxID=708437 RepID=A0A9P6N636_9BASI|nr:hypothetical protein CROQUDRAFT_665557 [Cronartium quercuum f. sp. fusiforme G11]
MSNQTPDIALTLWLSSLELSTFGPKSLNTSSSKKRTLEHLSEIQDGDILWQILATLDSNFFRAPRPSSMSGTMSETWVLRFTSFKKMYKLILRYFEEELRKKPKESLITPNLQKIAKDGDLDECVSLSMIILTLATLVQPDIHVHKIQALPVWAQTALMVGIQSISNSLLSLDSDDQSIANEDVGEEEEDNDLINKLIKEKEEIKKAHEELIKEYQILKNSKEQISRQLFLTEQDLLTLKEETEEKRSNRIRDDDDDNDDNDKTKKEREPDYRIKSERDQLRIEVTNIGNKLDQVESNLEKSYKTIEDQKKKLDELNDVEEINRGLRDQLDEFKHESERARKLENVIEKYKKKLDESADLRRQLKTLEEQNSDLLDRNASLEDEYRKIAAFKPLMEQYKTQISNLETTVSNQRRELDRSTYEIETLTSKLTLAEEEREREVEELALYEERVKELEGELPLKRRVSLPDDSMASFDVRAVEEETGIMAGIGGELNDAIEGRTMTSLKLELRKLKRELRVLRSGENEEESGRRARELVLENLLEDSNRMKRKYEDDYLNAYREKLMLNNQLEEIRSGKSSSGDGPEATIALRMRLNETVEELEKLKAEHAELSVMYEQISNELTTAKSDLVLVGKDQLEILSSLRESVSTEKIGLMNEVERLKNEQNSLRDQMKMKTDQIQSLLLEKINLQSDSIDTRQQMLSRERELSHQSKSNNDDYDERIQVGVLERVCKEKEDELKIVKTKLEKARMFIIDQHKMIQQQATGSPVTPLDLTSLTNSYEEMEQSLRVEITSLREEIDRLKTENKELSVRYEKELRLMGSAWHNLSQQKLREMITLNRNDSVRNISNKNINLGGGGTLRPHSWITQQRDRLKNRDALR